MNLQGQGHLFWVGLLYNDQSCDRNRLCAMTPCCKLGERQSSSISGMHLSFRDTYNSKNDKTRDCERCSASSDLHAPLDVLVSLGS